MEASNYIWVKTSVNWKHNSRCHLAPTRICFKCSIVKRLCMWPNRRETLKKLGSNFVDEDHKASVNLISLTILLYVLASPCSECWCFLAKHQAVSHLILMLWLTLDYTLSVYYCPTWYCLKNSAFGVFVLHSDVKNLILSPVTPLNMIMGKLKFRFKFTSGALVGLCKNI